MKDQISKIWTIDIDYTATLFCKLTMWRRTRHVTNMAPSKSGRFIIDGVPEFKEGEYQGIRAQVTISRELDFVKLAEIICKESKQPSPHLVVENQVLYSTHATS